MALERKMFVTAAICTWNRAKLLDATLTQLERLIIPDDVDWELLVVNNNCTDETDRVIEKYRDRLPIRRLFESCPGVASARNCAVEAAEGELMVWTDDDVLVDPLWLSTYVDASRQYPDAVFFGGPIFPWFESTPPAWIEDHLETLAGVYALLERTPEPSLLTASTLPFGASFAVRTEVQKRHLYNPKLGRLGKQLLCGEETSMYEGILAEGHHGYWIPDAKVKHFIPEERLTLTYVRNWFHGYGVSNMMMGVVDGSLYFGDPLTKENLLKKKAEVATQKFCSTVCP